MASILNSIHNFHPRFAKSSHPFSSRVFGFHGQKAGIISNSIFNFDSPIGSQIFPGLSGILFFLIDTWRDDGRGGDIHLLL